MNSFAEISRVYTGLMASRDFEQCKILLAAARDDARSEAMGSLASSIGTLLASVHISLGEDDLALDAFLAAARDNPGDIFLKLKASSFLLAVMKRPEEAIAGMNPVLPALLQDEGARHATLGVLGASHAALGHSEEARSCFSRILADGNLPAMYAGSYDFFLVESLVALRSAVEECREYLEIVLRSAMRDDDQGVAQRASALLKSLP